MHVTHVLSSYQHVIHIEHPIDERLIFQLAHIDTPIIRTSVIVQLDYKPVEPLVPLSGRLLKSIKGLFRPANLVFLSRNLETLWLSIYISSSNYI